MTFSKVVQNDLYFKGMAYFYKRGVHMFEGLRCFEEALRIDSGYALALSGLADTVLGVG
jgi:hypothetical protein